jgi:apolipoprotein D and lipocalin family protein
MARFLFFMFLASVGFVSSARARALAYFNRDLTTVDTVDLSRYSGRWYEIARLPNFFEKNDMTNITADYDVLPSGRVTVCNGCHRGNGRETEVNGVARAVDGTNTKLEVAFAPGFLRFLPFVWGNYWILDLDADYQWSLVGEPTRKYLWILARQPEMSEDVFRTICSIAQDKGYDITDLIRPLQRH